MLKMLLFTGGVVSLHNGASVSVTSFFFFPRAYPPLPTPPHPTPPPTLCFLHRLHTETGSEGHPGLLVWPLTGDGLMALQLL